ncbi:MAG: hypothetical protein ABJE47_00955 [bacterium]
MIILTFAAILLVAAMAHLAGRAPSPQTATSERALGSGGAVAGVFAATFVVMWYSWGSAHPIPVVHDEMAYALQAQIFARGVWGLPSPVAPAFWEQPYILLQPVMAAKYFPGHALVLSLGALAGWLPLMPLVMQSINGSLLFMLARRTANGGVAMLAWVVWLFSPMVLYFGPSYYSEATTTVCWLAGWWALLNWRETRRATWLCAVAFLVGWGAITRPLTGLAYAIPVGVLVLRDVLRGHQWRSLAMAMLVGALVMGILPLWSARTTGDWRTTPLALYTREYMPYDLPGFGLTTTPPTHSLTPEMAHLNQTLMASHSGHTPAAVPGALIQRSRYLWESTWSVSSGVLSIFALLGLLTLTGTTAFAVGSSVWLLVVYLTFATPAKWTLYYYEAVPALAFLTASGVAWAAAQLGRPRAVAYSSSFSWASTRYQPALLAGALVLILPGLAALQAIQAVHRNDRKPLIEFNGLLASLPGGKAVMFVRHAPDHDPHLTFIRNSPDVSRDRVWVVYDRGEVENAEFLDRAKDRRAYLFDEAQGRAYLYEPHSVP